MKVVSYQPYAPAAFTSRIILVLILLEAESTPGHMERSDATEKPRRHRESVPGPSDF